MTKFFIEPCNHGFVREFMSAAAKERTSLKDSANTDWYAIWHPCGVSLMGVGGVYRLGSGSGSGCRIKGIFVLPEERGLGAGSFLVDSFIAMYRDRMEPFIEAYAWNSKFYLERGFKVIGRASSGAEKLRKNF